MSERFIDLSPERQLVFLRKAQTKTGFSERAVEKDYWVCWVLEKLFDLPLTMAFKG